MKLYAKNEESTISEELLRQDIVEGNCRLSLLDYFFICHNIYLKPADILLPKAYKYTGFFVKNFFGDFIFSYCNLYRSFG